MIELKNVKFGYTSDAKILKSINYRFELGKVYAILGSSGCGKTTLLSLMGGLEEEQEGEILCDGVEIKKIGYEKYRKNYVAFVFQNYNLIPYMTAKENVELTAVESPSEALENVGITGNDARRIVKKLSGGQQQRVAIARALASNAKVILADEPTGNLDEETADTIADLLIRNAHQLNRCVIIVTHSLELSKKADVVIKLSKGIIHIDDEE